ncbi:hypothetical protein ATCC90586_000001 [Pythium insidiosum]|nr:hypothetical protein ATCC90586_000001 [Pythium insidiosum]
MFECAQLEVPLCYDGVCESGGSIDLFVRRRLAKHKPRDSQNRAHFLLSGGPGKTSVVPYAALLGDTVDMYTIDHRGTGRSEFLQCEAAQAMTGGSPNGVNLATEELGNCLQDLNVKYDGNAAAFSVTSAALDIQTVIEMFMPEHKVFLHGASYGTFLSQRVMQLQIPQIVGYIFDGVDVMMTKNDPIERSISHWNQAILPPSRRLLESCFDDEACPIHFNSRDTVLEEVNQLIDSLDEDYEINACGRLLMRLYGSKTPSTNLRGVLTPPEWLEKGSFVKFYYEFNSSVDIPFWGSFTAMEDMLFDEVINKRLRKEKVTRTWLAAMGAAIYASLREEDQDQAPFAASAHWVSNFMSRYGLSLRRRTNLTILSDDVLVEPGDIGIYRYFKDILYAEISAWKEGDQVTYTKAGHDVHGESFKTKYSATLTTAPESEEPADQVFEDSVFNVDEMYDALDEVSVVIDE